MQQVGHDVSLKTLSRSVDVDTPTLWYAQDAGGAIWKIDIVVSHTVSYTDKIIISDVAKERKSGVAPL